MSHQFPSPESWDRPKPPPEPGRRLRKDWWTRTLRRFADMFRRPWVDDSFPPPIQMPTLLDVHEPSDGFTFETPALGDAFNFRIRVRCSWAVQATASEDETEEKLAEVRKFIADSRAITQDRLEERIRPVVRNFPPYRAAEAEKALNDTISDCLNDGDVRVTVRAWVDVCDPVRDDLQKVWHDRVIAENGRSLESDMKKAQFELESHLQKEQLDLEGELKKAHIRQLGELQEEWRELLVDGLVGIGAVDYAKTRWLAPYALALAEDPKNAASYLKTALEGRVEHAEDLLAALDAAASDERIEAVEFAFQSQSVLIALLSYLGVPVPQENGATRGETNA